MNEDKNKRIAVTFTNNLCPICGKGYLKRHTCVTQLGNTFYKYSCTNPNCDFSQPAKLVCNINEEGKVIISTTIDYNKDAQSELSTQKFGMYYRDRIARLKEAIEKANTELEKKSKSELLDKIIETKEDKRRKPNGRRSYRSFEEQRG